MRSTASGGDLDYAHFFTVSLKTSKLRDAVHRQGKRVPWEKLVAYTLAVYALYDSFYDIRFLMFLRKQEQAISSTKDTAENQWGYGQILAVFVWVPVLVEYFYILGLKLGIYRAVGRHLFGLGCRLGLYEKESESESLASHEYQMVEQHVFPKGDDLR